MLDALRSIRPSLLVGSCLAAAGLVGSLALGACGGTNNGSGFSDGGSSGSSGGSGSSSGSSGGGSGSSGSGSGSSSGSLSGSSSGSSSGGGSSDCSAASQLVYVLGTDNTLWSFNPDPSSKAFKQIGTGPINCQTSMTPNSMAVARDGTAWVNYVAQDQKTQETTGGAIFKVSTTDASCQPTNVTLTSDFYQVGMGFSTNSATGTDETLFIAATGSTAGLATLDTTAQTVTPVAAFNGSSISGEDAELTGTGDARLFGFFVPLPSGSGLGGLLGGLTGSIDVAQIDKGTAAISNPVKITGIPKTVEAWAFSFWGGDFYLYTSASITTGSSTVTHYSPSTGTIDNAYTTAPNFVIDGAGVSTCAPTTQPVK